MKNLTDYEKKTGWHYSITCTNIPLTGIGDVPGCHQPPYIDMAPREHACVETAGVRTAKAMGLRGLPSKSWQVNKGWVIATNIAAWTRLFGHHDDPGCATRTRIRSATESGTYPPATPGSGRAISPDWPWKDAFLACWQRLCVLPAPA